MSTYEMIVEAVNEQTRQYIPVSFPIQRAKGSNTTFLMVNPEADGGKISFKLGPEGSRYFIHALRLRGEVAPLAQDNSNASDFVSAVNAAAKEKDKDQLIAAIVDGELFGLLHNYNEVEHEELLTGMQEAGIHTRISDYILDHRRLRVYVKAELSSIGEYGLVVENGTVGTVALGYRSYFKIPGYEYTFPDKVRIRHLSQVEAWKVDFDTLMSELLAIEVDAFLGDAEANSARSAVALWVLNLDNENLKSKATEILAELDATIAKADTDIKNGLDVVVELVSKIARGRKTAVRKMIDQIMDWATEQVTKE